MQPVLDLHDHEPDVQIMSDDVLRGLSEQPKRLPSQYLYDDRGAILFEDICKTDDYYLTRAETAILQKNLAQIADRIGPRALVLEPGSGSGIKTKLLLEALEAPVGYIPIDVAREQLENFAAATAQEFPDLEVLPVCADFTSDYKLPESRGDVRTRVAFFPGSTIGNFHTDAAIDVLRHVGTLCEEDGSVIIGVDLKKDAETIGRAYDDSAGVSREFALNYLHRLNRELDADFAVDQFDYEAPFNEARSRVEMALVSKCEQTVSIDGKDVEFAAMERCLTEFSYKYDLDEFAALAGAAGLVSTGVWTDSDEKFSVHHLQRA